MVAHFQTVSVAMQLLSSRAYRSILPKSWLGDAQRVRPVLDVSIVSGGRGGDGSTESNPGVTLAVSEAEQFKIYDAVLKGSVVHPVDKFIEIAVRREMQRGKTTTAVWDTVVLSEACRWLICPAVCSQVVKDVAGDSKYKMRHHTEPLAKHLSALYFEVCHWKAEKRLNRYVLYGPGDMLGHGDDELEGNKRQKPRGPPVILR